MEAIDCVDVFMRRRNDHIGSFLLQIHWYFASFFFFFCKFFRLHSFFPLKIYSAVLHLQLEQAPTDFFQDPVSNRNFLVCFNRCNSVFVKTDCFAK